MLQPDWLALCSVLGHGNVLHIAKPLLDFSEQGLCTRVALILDRFNVTL